MPEITINGVPTILQRDGTHGKLELLDGRILRLTCKVDVTDRRLMDVRRDDMPVSIEIHRDLHTAVMTPDGMRSVGDRPNVLCTMLMWVVRCEHDVTTLNEHWLVLECEPIRDRSGPPTVEEEMGL